MKEANKTPRDLIKEVQPLFNKFIRLRDREEDCISSNRTNEEVEGDESWKVGGAWDCGHYLSVGAYPELRFEELNAHKQSKSDNAGSGKYTNKNHTVQQQYRINLIERIGIYQVEWLEGPHEPKKYTCDDLRELKTMYKLKIKELIK